MVNSNVCLRSIIDTSEIMRKKLTSQIPSSILEGLAGRRRLDFVGLVRVFLPATQISFYPRLTRVAIWHFAWAQDDYDIDDAPVSLFEC